MTQTIDETELKQLMGQLVGHMTGRGCASASGWATGSGSRALLSVRKPESLDYGRSSRTPGSRRSGVWPRRR